MHTVIHGPATAIVENPMRSAGENLRAMAVISFPGCRA